MYAKELVDHNAADEGEGDVWEVVDRVQKLERRLVHFAPVHWHGLLDGVDESSGQVVHEVVAEDKKACADQDGNAIRRGPRVEEHAPHFNK